MKVLLAATLIALMLGLTGCAAMFASKSTPVAMQTTPTGAEVWVDGNNRGTTPVSLDLSNKKTYIVTFKRDGFADATYEIKNGVGAGWILLDILGGLVPVVIDAATGAWYHLDSKVINQNLVAKKN